MSLTRELNLAFFFSPSAKDVSEQQGRQWREAADGKMPQGPALWGDWGVRAGSRKGSWRFKQRAGAGGELGAEL